VAELEVIKVKVTPRVNTWPWVRGPRWREPPEPVLVYLLDGHVRSRRQPRRWRAL